MLQHLSPVLVIWGGCTHHHWRSLYFERAEMWATEKNHLQARSTESTWTPVSWWKWISNLELLDIFEFIWVKDTQVTNLLSLNCQITEHKKFKFLGLHNFRIYCIKWALSQKVQILEKGCVDEMKCIHWVLDWCHSFFSFNKNAMHKKCVVHTNVHSS